MDIKNLEAEDLMERNLQKLLKEVEKQLKAGNYQDLEKCLAKLAQVGENLQIKTNDDGSRIAVVETKDENGNVIEDIDFIAVVEKLKERFEKGVKVQNNSKDARRKFLANVDKTLGTLLKENEITETLINRGVSNDTIKANGEKEILRSQEKVKKLEPKLEKLNQIRDLLGEDNYIESAKKWDSKSDTTKIKDANQAEKTLIKMYQKYDEMKDLTGIIGNGDIGAQEENKKAIAKLVDEIQKMKISIDDLQITGLDLSELDKSKLNSWNDNSINSKMTLIDNNFKNQIKVIKNKTLDNMRTAIRANQADFQEFLPDGVSPDNLTEEQLMEVSKKIDTKIKMYNKEIKYEQEYQNITRESVDKFKESIEKKAQLDSKYAVVSSQVKVPVYKRKVKQRQKMENGQPVVDRNGNPIMENETDSNGNLVYETDSNGAPVYEKDANDRLIQETDANGDPVYEKDAAGNYVMRTQIEHVAKPTTRADVLNSLGINSEAAYIDTAKTDAETAIANLSASEKRALIRETYRQDGKFHPLKFLRSQFAPNSMWESGYKTSYVLDATSKAESNAKDELDAKVKNATQTEIKELKDASSLAIATKDFINREFGSAVSRERILYNAKQGVDKGEIEDKATRAAIVTGFAREKKYIEFLAGEITREELEDALKVINKDESKERVYARAYSDDVRNPQQYNKTHKKTFTDRDER